MKLHMQNVYLTTEQKAWLKENPDFNFSGYVRKQFAGEIALRDALRTDKTGCDS